MTIVGAILSPMVVFTTCSAEQFWGDRCLGFCSGDMHWFMQIYLKWKAVYHFDWMPFLPSPLLDGCEYLLPKSVGPDCTGYTSLILKQIKTINVLWQVLVHSVFCCLNHLFHLANGFPLIDWGHMVMTSLHIVCQHPVGQKEFLLICPALCLGVDVGFLGLVDCAGVCHSPKMGLTLFKL